MRDAHAYPCRHGGVFNETRPAADDPDFQAFNTMYQLELSCRAQVDALAGGQDIVLPPDEVIAHTATLYQPGTRRPYGVLEWHAMLRLLDAESKNSGYPPYWH